jgi:hypothetical protein
MTCTAAVHVSFKRHSSWLHFNFVLLLQCNLEKVNQNLVAAYHHCLQGWGETKQESSIKRASSRTSCMMKNVELYRKDGNTQANPSVPTGPLWGTGMTLLSPNPTVLTAWGTSLTTWTMSTRTLHSPWRCRQPPSLPGPRFLQDTWHICRRSDGFQGHKAHCKHTYIKLHLNW